MVDTLQDAIVHRGSSLADEQYRDLFGAIGEYQTRHQVYDREGRGLLPVRHRHRPGEGQRPLDVLLHPLPDMSGTYDRQI